MNAKNPLARMAAVALTLAVGSAWAQAPHAHEGHGPAKLTLNHGKKWQTDAPLREGMAAMRAEVAGSLQAIHEKRYAPAQYAALAGKLEQQVSGIVAQCKLPADADAQLHLVLAELLAGTGAMKGEKGQREGAVRVIGALEAYGKHFQHPGWKSLAH
jgi:hypothetical protein